MTIGFGFIHEQTLQIPAAAVHHFDGHSSPLRLHAGRLQLTVYLYSVCEHKELASIWPAAIAMPVNNIADCWRDSRSAVVAQWAEFGRYPGVTDTFFTHMAQPWEGHVCACYPELVAAGIGEDLLARGFCLSAVDVEFDHHFRFSELHGVAVHNIAPD